MENLQSILNGCIFQTGITVVVVIASVKYLAKQKSRQKQKEQRKVWNERGKDVVTLHMFPRARLSPNPSPFPIKLEAYLKLADIKYVPDFEQPISTKGKSPWITINGVDVADSQLAIEYLTEKLGKDVENSFTPEQRAKSRAIRIMIEEHFYFCVTMERWVYLDPADMLETFAPTTFPSYIPIFMRAQMLRKRGIKNVLPKLKAQGIGRHTKEEVYKLLFQDLDALSALMGDKPFFLGDRPCLADLSLFGFTSQSFAKTSESRIRPYIQRNCPNLLKHHKRLVELIWPDYKNARYGAE